MAATSRTPVCTVLRLRRATRKATRAYDRHFADLGIGIAQFGILQTIAGSDRASISDIAAALDMDRTTLTRNLKPLISNGYTTLADSTDGRSRIVTVTPSGNDLLREARRAWTKAQGDLTNQFGQAETDELHRLLALLLAKLPTA